MTPEEHDAVMRTLGTAVNIEQFMNEARSKFSDIEHKLSQIGTAGVDLDALAKKVADVLSERLKA